jgi:hypothetical protein
LSKYPFVGLSYFLCPQTISYIPRDPQFFSKGEMEKILSNGISYWSFPMVFNDFHFVTFQLPKALILSNGHTTKKEAKDAQISGLLSLNSIALEGFSILFCYKGNINVFEKSTKPESQTVWNPSRELTLKPGCSVFIERNSEISLSISAESEVYLCLCSEKLIDLSKLK